MSTSSLKNKSRTSKKPLLVGSIRASRIEPMYGWILTFRSFSALGSTSATDKQKNVFSCIMTKS